MDTGPVGLRDRWRLDIKRDELWPGVWSNLGSPIVGPNLLTPHLYFNSPVNPDFDVGPVPCVSLTPFLFVPLSFIPPFTVDGEDILGV